VPPLYPPFGLRRFDAALVFQVFKLRDR